MRKLILIPLVAAAAIAAATLYRSQTGQQAGVLPPAPIPTSLASMDVRASLAELDQSIEPLQARAATPLGDWFDQESLTINYQSRFRLTGDYADLVAARAAADKGIAMAIPGSGPLLARAGVYLTAHRVKDAARDLDSVDHFVVPDVQTLADAKAMRGDIAMAKGRYGEAAGLFDEAG